MTFLLAKMRITEFWAFFSFVDLHNELDFNFESIRAQSDNANCFSEIFEDVVISSQPMNTSLVDHCMPNLV